MPTSLPAPAALLAAVLLVAALIPGFTACGPRFPEPRAIVLISLDTLRADMLGAYGYDEYPTSPFLDSFAEDHVLFENCIVQEPRTLTSHMSLLTGLYPHHHRVRRGHTLSEGTPTLAGLLRQRGYATAAFVDDGYMDAFWGYDQGFDLYDSGERGGGLARNVPLAEEWLAEHGDEKFFLFLHTYDIHSDGRFPLYTSPEPFSGIFSGDVASPLNVEDRPTFRQVYRNRRDELTEADRDYIEASYADGVRYVDERLRLFFDTLRESDWYDDALIVIWSDHGEGLHDHEDWAHGEVYDDTIRVPLIVKIPGHDRAGQRVRSVVESIDLAPTILELAGVEVPEEMDGESILPLLEQEDESRVAYTLRTKRTDLLFSIRTLTHHYFWDGQSDEAFFFDLRADPEERNNLAGGNGPVERDLRRRLAAWVVEYERAWAEAGESPETLPDPELLKELRALGYLR